MATNSEEFSVRVSVPGDGTAGKATIFNDFPSAVSEGPASMQCDSGHEKLISSQPSTGSKIEHCRVSKPPSYLHFALVTILCNCPFGCLALLFAVLSERKYRSGHIDEAKSSGNVSKWLSIVGIAVSSVVVAFLIVYFVYIDNSIIDSGDFRALLLAPTEDEVFTQTTEVTTQ